MAVRTDINKDSIMKMLRTDVFGFKAMDIEEKAKEVYSVVSTNLQPKRTDVIYAGGYVRNLKGLIILTRIDLAPATKGKKGKK